MSKRITTDAGHYYKVRVALPGALIHLASSTEPKVHCDAYTGSITRVQGDWLEDPDKGDTLGYIDWPNVAAVTWRWTGTA